MPGQSGYWDRSAAKTFTHPLSDDFTAALEHSDRILDYGCGYGRSLRARRTGVSQHGWRGFLA